VKAVVASRPEPGSAMVFWNSFVTKSFACSSEPPLPVTCAQAPRMFQRAEPEEPGFGVMTWTPGLTRLSHVLMPFGFPLRTTKTTTLDVSTPLVGVADFQPSSTSPALTSRVTSVSSE